MPRASHNNQRLRRYWDKHATSYDRQMKFFERVLLGDTRAWVCSQAVGDVLEVAIGTGLNLPFYPENIRLTGIEWSPAMLNIAQRRAAELGRSADLREGDAHDLPFADASFDIVVCTFSLLRHPRRSARGRRDGTRAASWRPAAARRSHRGFELARARGPAPPRARHCAAGRRAFPPASAHTRPGRRLAGRATRSVQGRDRGTARRAQAPRVHEGHHPCGARARPLA